MPDSQLPFAVGDRVQDSFGGQCTIIRVDPEADHGLGIIAGRGDDGTVLTFALVAHGFSPLRVKKEPEKQITLRRGATIYLGEDRIVILPRDRGTMGGGFNGFPLRQLPHDSTVGRIFDELFLALNDCKVVAPPTDLKALMKPLLTATGEKTWNAITRSFAYVDVREEGSDLIFSPWRPEKGAFLGMGKEWRGSMTDRAALALAFRAAAAIAMEEQNLNNPPPLS